jgi:hypothetical protein
VLRGRVPGARHPGDTQPAAPIAFRARHVEHWQLIGNIIECVTAPLLLTFWKFIQRWQRGLPVTTARHPNDATPAMIMTDRLQR